MCYWLPWRRMGQQNNLKIVVKAAKNTKNSTLKYRKNMFDWSKGWKHLWNTLFQSFSNGNMKKTPKTLKHSLSYNIYFWGRFLTVFQFFTGCPIYIMSIIKNKIYKEYPVNSINTAKPLNSGHLRFFKKLSIIERCPLLGGNLKRVLTFGIQSFFRYSRHVRYFECPLLGGFTV